MPAVHLEPKTVQQRLEVLRRVAIELPADIVGMLDIDITHVS